MSSLSAQYGFHDPDALYSHPSNSSLKTKRDNPNLLCSGDTVIIPDKTEKKVDRPDAQKHQFKAKGLRTYLRFLVEDVDGIALAAKKYKLEVGTEFYEGTTAGDGLIEHPVLATETSGKLTVWLDDKKTSALIWPLEIGALEPHKESSGIQARLNNLGFNSGKVDGIIGPRTKAAIKAFKKKYGLGNNDIIDDATKNKLKEVYGF